MEHRPIFKGKNRLMLRGKGRVCKRQTCLQSNINFFFNEKVIQSQSHELKFLIYLSKVKSKRPNSTWLYKLIKLNFLQSLHVFILTLTWLDFIAFHRFLKIWMIKQGIIRHSSVVENNLTNLNMTDYQIINFIQFSKTFERF